MKLSKMTLSAGLLVAGLSAAHAADWTTWGGAVTRNMVSDEKGIPSDFQPGKMKEGSDQVDPSTTKNVKWIHKTGSQTFGNVTVANGRVYVGTNNDSRKDPRFKGDYSLLQCLDEKTGKITWTFTVPKLGAGKVNDWEYLGICSSPTIEGDKVYLVTNRCDVICLDANGLKNGNQGYEDEGKYMAGLDNPAAPPVPLNTDEDADILWEYDMRAELNVFPHNITSCGPLVFGDYVYVSTANGVDWSHISIPSPKSPAMIAVNKNTGKLGGTEESGIGGRVFHGGWSSQAMANINGKNVLVYNGPDGVIYGFDPVPEKPGDDGVLKELWRYDANPPQYRFKKDPKTNEYIKDANGKLSPIKYARPDGPSEFIATPVIVDGKLYANIGQDPEHGEGMGNLVVLSLAKLSGDCSPYLVSPDKTAILDNPNKKGLIWSYDKINRAISTPAVHNGLMYTADFSGWVYCFDANTGDLKWKHDTLSHIWGSPLVVDGKVMIGNEDGDLIIFAEGPTEKIINTISFGDAIYSTPVAANGTLYIATASHLWAISEGGK